MKRILCWLICVLLGMLIIPWAAATEPYDVTITADFSQEGRMLNGLVTVEFANLELYHDQVKLSWHIYDSAGTELLFENERYPFSVENGRAEVPVNIQLPDLGVEDVCIRFDLVDEKNVFWFSTNSELNMCGAEVTAEITKTVVEITADFPTTIVGRQIKGNITVFFEDPALYHDQVKLSWHVYDVDGKDLAFENERLVLPEMDNGQCVVPVNIDLSDIVVKAFSVRFDLVDAKNMFWFSQNSQIDLRFVEAEYRYNVLRETAGVLTNAVVKQPVLLILNVVVDISVAMGILLIRKKKILK